jgi:hypothetical protein
MKNVLTALACVLGFFISYAMIAGLIATTFCLDYVTIAQCPLYVVFGSMFGILGGFIAGDAIQTNEF